MQLQSSQLTPKVRKELLKFIVLYGHDWAVLYANDRTKEFPNTIENRSYSHNPFYLINFNEEVFSMEFKIRPEVISMLEDE